MKYLCLVYVAREQFDALSGAESDALTRESLAYDGELQRSGRFLCADALQPTTAATTVRVRQGRVSTTDGPFAETKEQLCGFILIDAPDLNDALAAAAGIPCARIGSVEVRPILDMKALIN